MNGNTSKGFRDVVLNGEAITIAAALLMALAIYSFLQTLVEAMIDPLVAAIVDEPSLIALRFTVNGNEVSYGSALIGLILLVLAFAVLVGLGKVRQRVEGGSSET